MTTDHSECIKALEQFQREMQAAIDKADEQFAQAKAKLDRLDRANEALAATHVDTLRQIRELLECGRASDALRLLTALCETVPSERTH